MVAVRPVRSPLGSMLVLAGFVAPAQAVPVEGDWVAEPASTAEYCVDGVCEVRSLDATLRINLDEESGLLGWSAEIVYAIPGIGDLPVPIAGVTTIQEPPFEIRDVAMHGSFESDMLFRFVSDHEIQLDGFQSIDEPSLPLLDVTIVGARFTPIPEPSAGMMAFAGLVAVAVIKGRESRVRRSRAGRVAPSSRVGVR